MVNLLLTKGANINAFDKKDGRALHWAAFMGKRQIKDGVCGNRQKVPCAETEGSIQKVAVLTDEDILWQQGKTGFCECLSLHRRLSTFALRSAVESADSKDGCQS